MPQRGDGVGGGGLCFAASSEKYFHAVTQCAILVYFIYDGNVSHLHHTDEQKKSW